MLFIVAAAGVIQIPIGLKSSDSILKMYESNGGIIGAISIPDLQQNMIEKNKKEHFTI